MSATDELRAMLDERGVEWASNAIPLSDVTATFWIDCNGNVCSAVGGTSDLSYSMLSVQANFTPAQAIAATLGVETCRNVHKPPKNTTFWPTPHFKCSECGATHVSMEYVYFCPNCGAKVVDE